MKDIEKKIKEERTIEAVRKNLMGPSGKLGCIVRYMGFPLWEFGGTGDMRSLEETYGNWEISDSDIPTLDMDDTENVFGWRYDGLSSGMHLEIEYKNLDNTITVGWKGYTVYREASGELESYVPLEDWEEKIESLYKIALKRAKREKVQENIAIKQEATRNKEGFLQYLKKVWGLR